MEIGVEHDPVIGRQEEDLSEDWVKLARRNVNEVPELREERIARLQELLDERGIKLFPGDERQLLMILRAGNSDPEVAVEVAKKYIAFSRYVLDRMPEDFEEVMWDQVKTFTLLPYRDKYGRRVAAMKLWDPERATPEHLFCVAFLTTIVVAKEPKTQIAGMSVLFDIEGCSWRHSPKLKTLLALVKIFYGGAPVYFRRLEWANMSFFFRNMHRLVEGHAPEDCDAILKNYGEWLPKEFGGKAEIDGTELVKSILAEKDYLEQLRRTCDYNVLV